MCCPASSLFIAGMPSLFHSRMLDHVRGNAFTAEEPVACLPVLIDLFPYPFRRELRRE